MARVKLLDLKEMDPALRETFIKMQANGFELLNIYRVLAHSPPLCEQFMRFGNRVLFKAKLDAKLRELAILRVAHLTRARYERVQHEAIAQRVGVTPQQVRATRRWQGSRAFSDLERAVLQFTDELTERIRVRQPTVRRVRRDLDEQELVELTLTIGFYGMVARFLEGLQVDLEGKDFYRSR